MGVIGSGDPPKSPLPRGTLKGIPQKKGGGWIIQRSNVAKDSFSRDRLRSHQNRFGELGHDGLHFLAGV
jgi:hypothetical protein